MTATQGEPGLSDTEGAPAGAAAASSTEQSVSDSESPGPRRGSDSGSSDIRSDMMMPSKKKKKSSVAPQWVDGTENFPVPPSSRQVGRISPRPTFKVFVQSTVGRIFLRRFHDTFFN